MPQLPLDIFQKEYIPYVLYAGERRRKALPWYGTALACIGKRALSRHAKRPAGAGTHSVGASEGADRFLLPDVVDVDGAVEVDHGEVDGDVLRRLVGRRRRHDLVGLVVAGVAGRVGEAGQRVALVEAAAVAEVKAGA